MGRIRAILNWYARLTPGRYNLKAPYEHFTQIGDPILRKLAEPVDPKNITSMDIQNVINKMRLVMTSYKSVGIAAPQIGVSKRIICIEFKEEYKFGLSSEKLQHRQISTVPFTVLINPTLKVLDYTKVSHHEACESVKGYQAIVPRYQAVEISGHNESAEPVIIQYNGWPARIVQHEMDHLDGRFYTDIMHKKTFECICWEKVNLSRGKVEMPFYAS